MVSGKRRRLEVDGVNLDLTYITTRIIAMSYPSSGIESMYRNPIDKVSLKFHNCRLHNSWTADTVTSTGSWTLRKERLTTSKSLAGESLTTTGLITMGRLFLTSFELQSSYSSFWMVKIAQFNFLEDPENVIVVHCNSGKGRTGTAIVCFLLFCGFCDNVDDALKFYGHKRFTGGKGVS